MSRSLIVLFFLVSPMVISQITFEPGYFIDNNGKRTECLIQNLDWSNHPDSFKYRTSNEGALEERTLDNTSEFGFKENVFRRFSIKSHSMANTAITFEDEKFPKLKDITAFLKLLVKGSKELYSHKNNGSYVFYVKDKDDSQTPSPLIYTKYFSTNTTVTINDAYKQQLITFLDCSIKQTEAFNELDYSEIKIINLFEAYYQCSGNKSSIRKKNTRDRKSLYFFGAAGLNINNLSTNYRGSELSLGSSISPIFSAGLTYNFPFYRNKLSVLGKIANNSLSNSVNTSYTVANTIVVRDDFVEFEYQSIDFSIGVRHFSYLNEYWSLFFEVYYGLPISEKAEINSTYGPNNQEFGKNTFVTFGVGVDYKNLEIGIQPFNKRSYDTFEENFYTSINIGYKL